MVIWLGLDIIKIKPPKTGYQNADISKNPNIQLSVNSGDSSHRSSVSKPGFHIIVLIDPLARIVLL